MAPHLSFSATRLQGFGIQLYTLRNIMQEDFRGPLQKLKGMGYTQIESFPSQKGHFWGLGAKEFCHIARDMGLETVSTHIGLGKPTPQENWATVSNGLEAFAQTFAEAGGKYLVCPHLDKSVRENLEGYKRVAADLNKAGEICKKAGIGFAYHNHAFEFETLEGQIPYQVLLKETDPELVKMELDLYWAAKAGQNVPALLESHPNRFPLVHVKDMGSPDPTTVEVGSGTLDFAAMFSKAGKAGIKYFLVEQDHCPGNPLDSIKKSADYLKKFEF
jgi:sugar phosphate isomerase/epimerase